MRIKGMTAAVTFALVACGGGEPAEQAPPAATSAPAPAAPSGPSMPDWIQADHTARTVTIALTAGDTNANNYWNFNGFHGGTGEIIVPQGYTVTINFVNRDPAMAHSVVVDESMASYPNIFSEVTPAFEGGVTQNPTSMTESTLPGESETMTFVAGQAGEYVLVCYVTGHAATGMWVRFTVASGQEVGVRQ